MRSLMLMLEVSLRRTRAARRLVASADEWRVYWAVVARDSQRRLAILSLRLDDGRAGSRPWRSDSRMRPLGPLPGVVGGSMSCSLAKRRALGERTGADGGGGVDGADVSPASPMVKMVVKTGT